MGWQCDVTHDRPIHGRDTQRVSQIGWLTLGADLIIVQADRSFLDVFGYRHDQLVGKLATDVLQHRVVPPEEHAIFEEKVLGPMREGKLLSTTWSTEIYRGDDGSKVSVGVQLRPLAAGGFQFSAGVGQVPRPQFPPGPEGELTKALIRETISINERKEILRLLHELIGAQQHQVELVTAAATAAATAAVTTKIDSLRDALLERLSGNGTGPPAADKSPKLNANLAFPEWTTYAGFRTHILANHRGQAKTMMAGELGIVSRTITRRMEYFGLEPVDDFWPPTMWPEEQPKKPRSVRLGPGALVAASLAASQCGHHLSLYHLLQVVSSSPGIGV